MTKPKHPKAVIEGLLYLWGDPLSLRDMADVLEMSPTEVAQLLEALQKEYDSPERGLQLKRYGDAYQFVTKEDHVDWFSKLIEVRKPPKLSHSSMETLAIIAYRQPVTRVEVDNIRGVKSSSSVDTLLSRGLIEEAGRLDRIGRPILYRTTTKFLQVFDLTSLEQLPALPEESGDEELDATDDVVPVENSNPDRAAAEDDDAH